MSGINKVNPEEVLDKLKKAQNNCSNKNIEEKKEEKINKLYYNLLNKVNIPNFFKKANFKKYDKEFNNNHDKVEYVKKFANKQPENVEHFFLYLCGNTGNGKTYLAVSALKQILYNLSKKRVENNPHKSVPELISNSVGFYMDWENDIENIKSNYGIRYNYSQVDIYHKAKNKEIVIIDDLFGNVGISSSDFNFIINLINYRYSNGKITIITSNFNFVNYIHNLEISDFKDSRKVNLKEEQFKHTKKKIIGRIMQACKKRLLNFEGKDYRISK